MAVVLIVICLVACAVFVVLLVLALQNRTLAPRSTVWATVPFGSIMRRRLAVVGYGLLALVTLLVAMDRWALLTSTHEVTATCTVESVFLAHATGRAATQYWYVQTRECGDMRWTGVLQPEVSVGATYTMVFDQSRGLLGETQQVLDSYNFVAAPGFNSGV